MITTDHALNFENLAGVPSAADLTILANQLFPDLTEGLNGSLADTGSFEESQVEEALNSDTLSSTGTDINYVSPTDDFDWEHPFGSGSKEVETKSYSPKEESRS